MTLPSILIVSLLASLGWVHGKLPGDWWHAVEVLSWLHRLAGLLFISLMAGGLGSIVFWLPISFAYKRFPKISRKYLILLTPSVFALAIPAWGAYCSLQGGSLYSVLDGPESWYLGILVELIAITLFYLLIAGLYVGLSKRWIGEKLMAIGILGTQFTVGIALFFSSCFFALRPPL